MIAGVSQEQSLQPVTFFRRQQADIPKRKINGNLGLRELENTLGPFFFMLEEAEGIIPLGREYYLSLVLPNRPYIDGKGKHQIFFLFNKNGPSSSFLSVPIDVGKNFLREVSCIMEKSQVGSAKQTIIGINISSRNRIEIEKRMDFREFPNLHIAQSVPFIHAHVLSFPSSWQGHLEVIDFNSKGHIEMLRRKVKREMNIDEGEIKGRGGVKTIVNQMIFDGPSIAYWQERGVDKMVKGKFAELNLADWIIKWRLPQTNQSFPYGLEINLPFPKINSALQKYGGKIWQINSILEGKLKESYGLYPYNFTLLFIEENNQVKMIFCPHNKVRAGIMEAMGIILY